MIYLHMGYPRTSTTTIQKGLFDHVDILEASGYIYPKQGLVYYGHHNIYYDLSRFDKKSGIYLSDLYDKEKGGFEDLIEFLKVKKQEQPEANFIISSEAFINLNTKLLKRLAFQLQRVDDIACIIVVRRQDKYLLSNWSLEVERLQMTQEFEDWSTDIVTSNYHNLNYYQNLQKVSTCFRKKNIHFLSFKEMVAEGDPFAKFLETCNVDIATIEKCSATGKVNKSPDVLTLSLLHKITVDFGDALLERDKQDLASGIIDFAKRSNWEDCAPHKRNMISVDLFEKVKTKYDLFNKAIIRKIPNLESELVFDNSKYESSAIDFNLIPKENFEKLNSNLPEVIDISKYRS